MKRLTLLLATIVLSTTVVEAQAPSKKTIKSIDETLTFALEQTKVLYTYLEADEKLHPRTVKDGRLVTEKVGWWTSGFYPGTMWYLYEWSGDTQARQIAEAMTARTLVRQYATNDHDVGFQINCSAGNGYRITGNKEYRQAVVTAGNSLATRFNPVVGCTRSWNDNAWSFPVIIDNMMNLELLCNSSALSGDNSCYEVAVSHASTTKKALYRHNKSSYHLADFNPETGEVIKRQTCQGYSDDSSWARGQAWGLYGFTMMYRFTGDPQYLDHAIDIANFMISHPNMPKDLIPYWDFNAPNIPSASRDVSAAAIMASALVELSTYLRPELKKKFLKVAEKQVAALCKAPCRSANVGDNCGFILTNSVGFMAKGSEVDAPLTYADYYFVEAMLRLKALYEGKSIAPILE